MARGFTDFEHDTCLEVGGKRIDFGGGGNYTQDFESFMGSEPGKVIGDSQEAFFMDI